MLYSGVTTIVPITDILVCDPVTRITRWKPVYYCARNTVHSRESDYTELQQALPLILNPDPDLCWGGALESLVVIPGGVSKFCPSRCAAISPPDMAISVNWALVIRHHKQSDVAVAISRKCRHKYRWLRVARANHAT